jgi:hypothetical protein
MDGGLRLVSSTKEADGKRCVTNSAMLAGKSDFKDFPSRIDDSLLLTR